MRWRPLIHNEVYNKPITGNFAFTYKFNSWAKLSTVIINYGPALTRQDTPYVHIKNVIEHKTIENKPCNAPFLAIRKFKIWIIEDYSNIHKLKPTNYGIRIYNQESY